MSLRAGGKPFAPEEHDLAKLEFASRIVQRPPTNASSHGRRVLSRICGVFGVLLIVFSLEVDKAANTATTSHWVSTASSCHGCRVPGWGWVVADFVTGVLGTGLIALAILLAHTRAAATANRHLVDALVGIVLLLAVVASILEVLTDVGDDNWGTNWGDRLDLVGFGLMALLVVVLAVGSRPPGAKLTASFRIFLARHRVNAVIVVIFAIVVVKAGYTSGQAIDSIRTWVAVHTLERCFYGLASSILVALVVYESGIRLTATHEKYQAAQNDTRDELNRKGLLVGGLVLFAVGAVGRWLPSPVARKLLFFPLGTGVMMLGAILLALLALDSFKVRPGEGSDVPSRPGAGAGESTESDSTAEWIAVIPLVAIAAITVAGAVDSMLSEGFSGSLWTLSLGLALALVAVAMTGRDKRSAVVGGPATGGDSQGMPDLPPIEWRHFTVPLVGFAAIAAIDIVVHDAWATIPSGVALLGLTVFYGGVLFYAGKSRFARTTKWLSSLPIAVAAAAVTVVGVRHRPPSGCSGARRHHAREHLPRCAHRGALLRHRLEPQAAIAEVPRLPRRQADPHHYVARRLVAPGWHPGANDDQRCPRPSARARADRERSSANPAERPDAPADLPPVGRCATGACGPGRREAPAARPARARRRTRGRPPARRTGPRLHSTASWVLIGTPQRAGRATKTSAPPIAARRQSSRRQHGGSSPRAACRAARWGFTPTTASSFSLGPSSPPTGSRTGSGGTSPRTRSRGHSSTICRTISCSGSTRRREGSAGCTSSTSA